MLTVESKIDMDFGAIKELEENGITALEQTADALLTEIKNAQVMPFDTGNLQNESTFADYSQSEQGVITLSSSTPYARRLYYHPEYNFSRKENSAAGGEWLKYWLPGGTRQNFCSDTCKIIYKRLCGL